MLWYQGFLLQERNAMVIPILKVGSDVYPKI